MGWILGAITVICLTLCYVVDRYCGYKEKINDELKEYVKKGQEE